MTIEWDDSYRIDDDEINSQHQTLFRYVNDFLRATSNAEMTLCVIHLFKYARQHFAYEEELMRKVGFPHYEQHLRMHDRLVSRLGALGDSIVQGTVDFKELEIFIAGWALGHIPKADARLANFLRARE